MTISHEIQVNCPVCDHPDLWLWAEADPPAPEVGMYTEGYSGTIIEQGCSCKLTDRQLNDLAEEYYLDLLDQLY